VPLARACDSAPPTLLLIAQTDNEVVPCSLARRGLDWRDSLGRVFALTAAGRRSMRDRREFGESVARLLAAAA
jgi:hypothetical protein